MLSNPFSPERIKELQQHHEIPDEERPGDRVAEHELQETARFAEHLRDCGCPDQAIDALTAGSGDTIATKAVVEWLPSPALFLLLLGGQGTGKTVAAVSAFRICRKIVALLGKNGPVRSWVYVAKDAAFVDADVLKAAAYNNEGQALHERASTVPLLIIDDLGIEVPDKVGIWQSAFDAIVKRREARKLRTIITANFTGEKFVEVYGARAYSRIKGSGKVVHCGDWDIRLKGLPAVTVSA